MAKEVLSQRPVQVAVVLFVIIGISGVLYLKQITAQSEQEIPRTHILRKPARRPEITTDPPQDGHFREDGTWHTTPHTAAPTDTAKQPERTEVRPITAETRGLAPPIPSTEAVNKILAVIPEDIFSEAYTEKLKENVQLCMRLFHQSPEIMVEQGVPSAVIAIHNAGADAGNLEMLSRETGIDFYREKAEELRKIVEPYKALFPKPAPRRSVAERVKARFPEYADLIEEMERRKKMEREGK